VPTLVGTLLAAPRSDGLCQPRLAPTRAIRVWCGMR